MSDKTITIVSGLPRSGTSLMMQMIHAGGLEALTDKIRAADDDNPRGYYEFEPVKTTKEDPSWLADAEGKVVKMVYMLLYDLPLDRSYRIVFMRRELVEVLRSQDAMLDRLGKPRTDMSHDQLVRTFEAQVRKAEAWLAAQPNFEVLYINYNELITNPEPAVDALGHFLGNTLDRQAMLGAIDPKLYRQRSG